MNFRWVIGVMTFAIGGTILAYLLYLLINSIRNTGIGIVSGVIFPSGIHVIILGFLGFLFVGMGLHAIVEDVNKANQPHS